MKIVDIEVIPVELPLVREHKMAYSHGERIGRFSVIKVRTDEGLIGWGEAPTEIKWGGDYGAYYGESQKTTHHIIKDFLEPHLKEMDPIQIEAIHQRMDQCVKGYPYAKAAIEMALLDIIGKAYGVPVFQLMFGLFRDEVPVQHSIGLMSPEDAAREASFVVEEGIRTIKLKIGIDPLRDVETVRQVRKAVGADIQIRVDGNRGYSSPQEAIKVIRKMEPFDLLLVEQPVEGLKAMATIAKKVDVPLMADEGVWSPQDVLDIYELQAAQMISVYITKPGGLIKAKKLVHTASTLGIRCGVGGMVELGIGTAANLHFIASTPEITLACGLTVPYPGDNATKSRIACSKYRDTLEKNPPEFRNGHLKVPKGPGLGIDLDEKKIQLYRV
jgi:muconate cycloisomerase